MEVGAKLVRRCNSHCMDERKDSVKGKNEQKGQWYCHWDNWPTICMACHGQWPTMPANGQVNTIKFRPLSITFLEGDQFIHQAGLIFSHQC